MSADLRIEAQGRIFHLNRPVRTIRSYEDGTWWCIAQELGISAFGRTPDEAMDSFREDFAAFWDAIAQAPDEVLSTDALAAKRAFHDLVKAVEDHVG